MHVSASLSLFKSVSVSVFVPFVCVKFCVTPAARPPQCSGRSGIAGAEEVVPEAVRVQFEGGTDEEWVKSASGDMRIMRTLSDGMPEEEAPEFASHSSYWLVAGAKNSDFTRQQAELLAELLEYRYVDLICLRAHCQPLFKI